MKTITQSLQIAKNFCKYEKKSNWHRILAFRYYIVLVAFDFQSTLVKL